MNERSSFRKGKNVPRGRAKSPEIRILKDVDRLMTNRCCLVRPRQRHFGQITEPGLSDQDEITNMPSKDRYSAMLEDQFGFEPRTTKESGTSKNELYSKPARVENSSQYEGSAVLPKFVETSDGTQWQHIDTIDDIEKFLPGSTTLQTVSAAVGFPHKPKKIHISDIPKVKIIAVKFSKFKRNNIELRRLDEKVVCVEYDVYDEGSTANTLLPIQRMRAFFSIKPVHDNDAGGSSTVKAVPSKIKRKFQIQDEDLKKLTDKEIEIIDDKIDENKSYLEDLRRILKRHKFITAKKNKASLDLQSLYDMASRHNAIDDFSKSDFLSKAQLQEVKDLIIKGCGSSIHGISRRRIKSPNQSNACKLEQGVLSGSIVAELLREDAKLNVLQ
ncbi:uncharacterized protein LOC142976152 [Anticarsia gemmatalis]|uniref:uncharacterized protein LOC142976152 n=1 Tax=Anticarsia gemmatalis TaxID=129554 RepID=UPI003F7588B1